MYATIRKTGLKIIALAYIGSMRKAQQLYNLPLRKTMQHTKALFRIDD